MLGIRAPNRVQARLRARLRLRLRLKLKLRVTLRLRLQIRRRGRSTQGGGVGSAIITQDKKRLDTGLALCSCLGLGSSGLR